MGIKELISKVIPVELKEISSFEVLRNRRMGVDVSNYMFKLVTTRDNLVRDFHVQPRVDISAHIEKYWDSFKKVCDEFNIVMVLVLDGKRNPAKLDTNLSREADRDKSFSKMNELLKNGDQDDMENLLKLQKATMTISDDMLLTVKIWSKKNNVKCIQSLFEADAGLQHLEDMGITDGTFSEDGDFFPLNSKLWATKVVLAKKQLIVFDSEAIRKCLVTKLHLDENTVMTADHGRVMSVLLGCDFLPRPKGFGPKTVENFISKWMTSSPEENQNSLLLIERGTKKRKTTLPIDSPDEIDGISNYRERFWLAFNMLKHPPVFKFTSLSDDAHVNVGLLGNIELPPSRESVLQLLGFDAFEDESELGDLNKVLFIDSDIFVRTMRPLLPIYQPRNDQGLLLPWGCNHDFSIWSPKMCTPDMLNKWLRTRGVRYSLAVSHAQLVESVLTLLREVPQREIIPLDELPDEADFTADPGGIQWELGGENNFSRIRDIALSPVISKDLIDQIFGHRGGVENRSMRLIPGGHFDLSTLKSCKIKCKVNNEMIDCVMFQMKSTPSMKSNAYAVNIVFSTDVSDIGGRFIKSPYSHCDCPAGQMFCSHMLGFLGIMRIIQRNDLLTFITAVKVFPESVKALSSTGILLEYLY